MSGRYFIEIFSYGPKIFLYEKKDDIFKCIGTMEGSYAIDKEIVSGITSRFMNTKPFLETDGRVMFNLEDTMGEILKITISILGQNMNLHEKLIFLERTQFLTLMQEGDLERLKDKLAVLNLVRKIGGGSE